LDSAAAYQIVHYITKVVRKTDVVAIMTLHQPSTEIFRLLDDIYLLEGGRLAFAGTQLATATHFASLGFTPPADTNPADFYLDLVNVTPQAAQAQLQQGGAGFKGRFLPDDTWASLYKGKEKVGGLAMVQAHKHSEARHDTPSEAKRLAILCRRLLYSLARSPIFYLRTLHLLFQVRMGQSVVSAPAGAKARLRCVRSAKPTDPPPQPRAST
jgi:ABC-type multidrug transport system ATPase subunit